MQTKNYIVISLGGSMIVPDKVDISFLNTFVKNLKEYSGKGFNFIIITGGGRLSREYNDIARQLNNPNADDLDWLGIRATRLNAELVRIAFGDYACSYIIMDPDNIPETNKSIILGGGWKPGNSSDLAAVHAAISVGAKKLINLSNIDFVYDKDPKKFSDAVPVREFSWLDFRALLPAEWVPGLNMPFDPIAAEKAESLGLEVVIMGGKNIENLKNYLDGKEFDGTTIK